MTSLVAAHAAMTAAPEDAQARLRFYEALIEGELVVLLEHEPAPGEEARPRQFPTAGGRLVLAFTDEAQLASFSTAPAAYAALPGRALVRALAGRGLGLGLNLGTGTCEFLMPAEAVEWLAGLSRPPQVLREVPPQILDAPRLPEALLDALRRKLGQAAGLAAHVLLAALEWPDGRHGHVLAFVGAAPGAEATLAQSVGEALTFSGLAETDPQLAQGLDVMFLAPAHPLATQLARVALRLDLPAAPGPEAESSAGPEGGAGEQRRAEPQPPRLR